MRDKYLFVINEANLTIKARARQLEVVLLVTKGKRDRRQAEVNARTRLNIDLVQAKRRPTESAQQMATHQALNDYEVSSLSRGSWANFLGEISSIPDLDLRQGTLGPSVIEVWKKASVGVPAELLGQLFRDHFRFEPVTPRDASLKNAVYRRKNDPNGRDYILLPSRQDPNIRVFVRRYVIRGLSGENAMQLKNRGALINGRIMTGALLSAHNPDLRANSGEVKTTKKPTRHNVRAGNNLYVEEALISHARGWSKRGVSTGVGSAPPVSTRGQVFTSLFGQLAVDLAKVDHEDIYDLHSPEAVKRNLGINHPEAVLNQGPSYPARDYSGEEYLALRDVLRTRELIIWDQIPHDALCYRPESEVILAVGFTNNRDSRLDDPLRNIRGMPMPTKVEPTTFKTLSTNKAWYYARYATSAQCDTAHRLATDFYRRSSDSPTISNFEVIRLISQVVCIKGGLWV